MQSNGFRVAFVDHASVIAALSNTPDGIDLDYDEHTPDAVAQQKVDRWERLTSRQKNAVYQSVSTLLNPQMDTLKAELRTVLGRQVQTVRVLPLHGSAHDCYSVAIAIDFIEQYTETENPHPLSKYEVQIRYNNGDKVYGEFQSKDEAISFLRTYQQIVALRLQQLQEQLEQDEEDDENA